MEIAQPEYPQITEGVEAGLEEAEQEGKIKGARIHCRTGKGNLQAWRTNLDDPADSGCRKCRRYAETDRTGVGKVGRYR